jgi:hypothetical protein
MPTGGMARRKFTMPRPRPSIPQSTAPQRFSIRLRPSTGQTRKQEEDFELQLAEYLAAREMVAEGTQLRMDILPIERDLGVQDLADLACWIMEHPAIGAVHLRMTGVIPTSTSRPWATASRSDHAVEPLVQLYRMGRIGAIAFFEVLRLVQPEPMQLEAD